MPFAPKLSSPPTSEELKAYYEWLSRPQEMKSAPPPLPDGSGPVSSCPPPTPDEIKSAPLSKPDGNEQVGSCPPLSPEETQSARPPLPVGVNSVEDLLTLAASLKRIFPTLGRDSAEAGLDSGEELLKLADREDALAQAGESTPLPAPSEQATKPLQADGLAANVIDGPKRAGVGQEQSLWLSWIVLAILLLLVPTLWFIPALFSQREHIPGTIISDNSASKVAPPAEVSGSNTSIPTLPVPSGATPAQPDSQAEPIPLDDNAWLARLKEVIRRDPKNAIAQLTEAIRRDPKNANLYHFRALIYGDPMRDYDKAIADYTAAIRLRPHVTVDYSARGWVYAQKGDYDNAIADYTEVIGLNPKDGEAYYDRGSAYYEKRDTNLYPKAEADFAKAKGLGYSDRRQEQEVPQRNVTPAPPPARSDAGDLYLGGQGDLYLHGDAKPSPAQRLAERAIHTAGGDIKYSASRVYGDPSATAEAVRRADQAVAFRKSSETYVGRGIAYCRNGNLQGALSDFNEAVRLDPRNARAYHNRGIAWIMLEHPETAIPDFTEAIRLVPGYAIAYVNRAMAYDTLGRKAEAEADLTKARQLGYESK